MVLGVAPPVVVANIGDIGVFLNDARLVCGGVLDV